MSSESEDKPYSDSHLDSPEYRRRLMRKLNTLIAVLEVASAKVRRSLSGPDPDVERLTRIQNNLSDTLKVCVRAKRALERCEELPADLPKDLGHLAPRRPERLPSANPAEPAGAVADVRTAEEAERLSKLGPIDAREIRTCDLDSLCRRLLGG